MTQQKTGNDMPSFSRISLERLETVDPRLREVLEEAIKHFDFTVLCGHRGKEEQNRLYSSGRTKVMWPDSKHNTYPSLAVDVAPYPIDWGDRERFYYLAGLIMGIAASKGLRLRWGGDWDMDGKFDDNRFDDLPHFEIVES
ncbi:MAG: peptidase [Phycisphaerae bacterium]|nr:MAG: peptidase [Phycisphaerae bacterium]